MEVAELYADPKNWPVFSAETFPTENFRPIDRIMEAVGELVTGGVRVVTTTWGALGSPRGGTASISRLIHERFGVPAVVHLNIQAKTRRDIESILRSLHLDGLHNILALGGDPPTGVVDYVPAELRHRYASGLVEQIAAMNRGLWLDGDGRFTKEGVKTRFGIGVAAFPEVHPDDYDDAAGFDASMARHLEHTKVKIDNGAHYAVDQMIFDAELHFRFVEAVREAGIEVPIVPAILPFDRWRQASRFVGEELRISMPDEVREALENADEEQQAEIAEEHLAGVVRRLLDGGVPGIHFYCMNRSRPTLRLLERAGV